MAVQSRVVLEPSAQGIVDATSTPPFLYELEPAAARRYSMICKPPRSTSSRSTRNGSPFPRRSATSECGSSGPPTVRDAAGHRVHARRRMDPRQRRHPRPARP